MLVFGALVGCGASNPNVQPQTNAPYPYFHAQDGALLVRPVTGAFGYADGLAAKAAAQSVCAGQGLRLNPAAFGQYLDGAWRFAKGCIP